MKKIIYEVDHTNRCFYIIDDNQKVGILLTHKQNKTYMPYLSEGILVDIQLLKKKTKHLGVNMYRLDYFNQIVDLKPYRIIFDIKTLRREMFNVITKYEHYLFIDFEMTMPEYRDFGFFPEIIQCGYVLTNKDGKVLEKDGFYVDTKTRKPLTNRTIKFLNISQKEYDKTKISYNDFYQKLKKIILNYHPQIITWGKNDLQVLNHSYEIHKKEPITDSLMFTDLLKLHKDYYRIKNDMGLFRTYQNYYKVDLIQEHDAQHDALVTFKVFEAFVKAIQS